MRRNVQGLKILAEPWDHAAGLSSSKVKRKTIEWENIEISSRKLEIPREFLAKTGTIKDRNGMDLKEAKDINKKWQEYTKELYKKDLHDQDNQDVASLT